MTADPVDAVEPGLQADPWGHSDTPGVLGDLTDRVALTRLVAGWESVSCQDRDRIAGLPGELFPGLSTVAGGPGATTWTGDAGPVLMDVVTRGGCWHLAPRAG